MKSILVGLDGLDWRVLTPLLASLPNLSHLKYCGSLWSPWPPLSPVAWTSLYTGKEPREHGIYGFFYRPDPESYHRDMISRLIWQAEPVWRQFNRLGLSFGGFNMPCVGIPEPLNGWMVLGLTASPRYCCEPVEVSPMLEFPDYIIDIGEPDNLATFEAHFTKLNAARWIIEQRHVDVGWFFFEFPDRLGHFAWPSLAAQHGRGWELFKRLMVATDTFIGELIERWPDAHITVLSDHGFGASFYLNINLALYHAGLLALKQPPSEWPADALLLDMIDWQQTQCYSLDQFGGIRANLKGRDPLGIVEPPELLALNITLEQMLGKQVLPFSDSNYANAVDAPDFRMFLDDDESFYISGYGLDFLGRTRLYSGDHKPQGLWLSNRERQGHDYSVIPFIDEVTSNILTELQGAIK